MSSRAYSGKAHRSQKAKILLENREHARELFNAIKALKPGEQLVSVAGVRFRTDAKPLKVAAND